MSKILFFFNILKMLTLAAVLAVLHCVTVAISGQPVYGIMGGVINLSPGPVSVKVTSVTWKHQDNIALEWFGGEVTKYRQFKNGSCSLNLGTGVLTISNLTREFSGKYTAEINNKDVGSQQVQVLSPVPKPSISEDCIEEKVEDDDEEETEATSCDLTCDHIITPDTEPLDYLWIVDDLEKFTTKEITITENDGTSFICVLKNPVSNKSSEALINPLKRGDDNSGTIIGIVFVVILLILVILLIAFIFIVKKTQMFNNNKLIQDMRKNGFKNGLVSSWNRCTGKKGDYTVRDEETPLRQVPSSNNITVGLEETRHQRFANNESKISNGPDDSSKHLTNTTAQVHTGSATASKSTPDLLTASKSTPDLLTASESTTDQPTASESIPDQSTASESTPDLLTASKLTTDNPQSPSAVDGTSKDTENSSEKSTDGETTSTSSEEKKPEDED